MLPTKIYTFTITANGVYRLQVQGQYFKILTSTALIKVEADFGTLDGIGSGQGLENTPFSYLVISDKSGATNTVSLLIGDKNFVDAAAGNVTIVNNAPTKSATFVNTPATVTNVSASMMAANTNRKYLLIQNNDASGVIYINFGAASTIANGIKIEAGGAFEPAAISTQEIFAIGSIASNSNVLLVEAS
jgi:hypothetical protein